MQQFKIENEQLHHQLVNRHPEPTIANKISVGCQTKKVGISYNNNNNNTVYACTYVTDRKLSMWILHDLQSFTYKF